MAQTFEDITKEVVNRFLQNILFIDDKAYLSENKANDFDACKISTVFAKEGKLCTVFAPSSENYISNCYSLYLKSDIVVLDWYLALTNENDEKDDEKDADMDEPRGFYTKSLIKEIVVDAKKDKLKLILVYTGETNLENITEEIYNEIKQYGDFEQDYCYVHSSNIVILIRAKYNGEAQFKHHENLKKMIVKYEELPSFISSEFAKLVNGLLPIFVLSAISVIRENTSKLLNAYSSELDIAYLGHKIVLPNPNESKDLLIKIFGESVIDLISSINIDTQNWLSLWIAAEYPNPNVIKISERKSITVDKNILERIITGNEIFDELIKTLFENLSKNDRNYIHNNAALLLSTDSNLIKKSNIDFAKLTHHKNIFSPRVDCPFLTLGTVVRSIDDNNYYLCIQQKCDSLRIDGIRRFLFLPLVEDAGNFHIVVNKDIQLKIAKSSFDVKTIKFRADDEKRYVSSECIIDDKTKMKKFIFSSIYDEKYEWVLELKDMHAQRVVNSYCSILSRVGLDESEWLRLLS